MKFHRHLCSAVLGSLAAIQSMALAADVTPAYVIVTPDNPPVVIQTAAKELADHMNRFPDSHFDIVAESQRPEGRRAIHVGPTKGSAAVFPDPTFANAKPDTISIRFVDGDIYLNGQMPRGPLYAVYTFLEDLVGIRWWTPEDTYIPSKLVIQRRDIEYAPAFVCRETFYWGLHQKTPFAARLKDTGHFSGIPAEFGDHRSIIGWCHTFYQWLPPQTYFEKHPEWYSMNEKGERFGEYSQLCLTNEEMRKEFVRVCLEKIAGNPSAGMISVSQNDWRGNCQCPACKAIEEEEGSPSGLLLRFVNAVAADIKKQYPDFFIETLAYQYTRHAPKITRPADNVVIRLCSIEMDFSQPLEDGPHNASFRKDIEDWSAIAKNLYIWNYVTNFSNYMLLQPNYRNLGNDLRFFAKHHAIGIFEQGDAGCSTGDFVRPRAWIIAHLLWNPNLDEKALAQEFFNGYYGAAGPLLLNYLDFLCDCMEKSGSRLPCYNDSVQHWLTGADLVKARALFQQAEDAVKDAPVLAERVHRERISLDVSTIISHFNMQREAFFNNLSLGKLTSMNAITAIKEDLFRQLDKWKPATWREGGASISSYKEQLEVLIKPAEVSRDNLPETCRNLPDGTWDVLWPQSFNLFFLGTLVNVVDDPDAFSGKAIRMTANHTQWAIQNHLGSYYGAGRKWKYLIRLRCNADAKDGIAAQFGVYNAGKAQNDYLLDIKVSECSGKDYVTIETAPVPFALSQYLWLAPVNRPPEEVKDITVDSIIMLRVDDNKGN